MSAALAALAARVTGRRVELAPHTDAWMSGDRYGTVIGATRRGLRVKLERSGRTITVTDEGISYYLD